MAYTKRKTGHRGRGRRPATATADNNSRTKCKRSASPEKTNNTKRNVYITDASFDTPKSSIVAVAAPRNLLEPAAAQSSTTRPISGTGTGQLDKQPRKQARKRQRLDNQHLQSETEVDASVSTPTLRTTTRTLTSSTASELIGLTPRAQRALRYSESRAKAMAKEVKKKEEKAVKAKMQKEAASASSPHPLPLQTMSSILSPVLEVSLVTCQKEPDFEPEPHQVPRPQTPPTMYATPIGREWSELRNTSFKRKPQPRSPSPTPAPQSWKPDSSLHLTPVLEFIGQKEPEPEAALETQQESRSQTPPSVFETPRGNMYPEDEHNRDADDSHVPIPMEVDAGSDSDEVLGVQQLDVVPFSPVSFASRASSPNSTSDTLINILDFDYLHYLTLSPNIFFDLEDFPFQAPLTPLTSLDTPLIQSPNRNVNSNDAFLSSSSLQMLPSPVRLIPTTTPEIIRLFEDDDEHDIMGDRTFIELTPVRYPMLHPPPAQYRFASATSQSEDSKIHRTQLPLTEFRHNSAQYSSRDVLSIWQGQSEHSDNRPGHDSTIGSVCQMVRRSIEVLYRGLTTIGQ